METAPAADERTLVITREFNAPPSLVFKAWTDPVHAARWGGPNGYTATHVTGDLRPGGRWRACLRRDEDGLELWQGGTYREVTPPERLVFTFAWDREDGSPGQEMLVTVTLAEERGRTRMTFRQEGFESVASRDGHQGGWTSAFDRLAEHLASVDSGGARSS
jgi:uncharacterized protein YndB with AHSA1/START domain